MESRYVIGLLALGLVLFGCTGGGVYEPEKFDGASKCGGFAQFTCIDQSITTSQVTLVLANSVGRTITYTRLTIDGVECFFGNEQIAPNSKLTASCDNTAGKVIAGDVGAPYDKNVAVEYTDSQTGLTHVDTGGFITGKIS